MKFIPVAILLISLLSCQQNNYTAGEMCAIDLQNTLMRHVPSLTNMLMIADIGANGKDLV